MLFSFYSYHTTLCCFGAVAIDAVQPLLSLTPLSRILKYIDFLDPFFRLTLTRLFCSFPTVTVWPPLRGGASPPHDVVLINNNIDSLAR